MAVVGEGLERGREGVPGHTGDLAVSHWPAPILLWPIGWPWVEPWVAKRSPIH